MSKESESVQRDADAPIPLKFDRRKVDPIASGEKTATVRYDDEKDIEAGDVLSMRSPDGREFTTAEVVAAPKCPARLALWTVELLEADHECLTWDELRRALNRYYDEPIRRETPVKVIAWEEVMYAG